MAKETILTDEEIIAIGHQARAIESGENGYILPIAFARAIEHAILQSEQVQALRKDAEWYHYIKKWCLIIAVTQTGVQIAGEELDDLIDSERRK